ncbi:helix-turn-helix domain-containing protein [Brucella intermedia]|uniref:helix-turn-helix domain-containing protein n=1 Tax=Brucella intermedia TaxID=94625 RepID=UPI0023621662|nr:helix-turn-helix domain-containing protein [Brucella intermedia]
MTLSNNDRPDDPLAFHNQATTRDELWKILLSRCSFIRGGEYYPGEPLTLNSISLFGEMMLEDGESEVLRQLLEHTGLSSFLFLYPLSGRSEIQVGEKPIECTENGILVLDLAAMENIKLKITGCYFFILVPSFDIDPYPMKSLLNGLIVERETRSATLFRVLELVRQDIETVQRSQLRDLKYAFLGAFLSYTGHQRLKLRARITITERIHEYIALNCQRRTFSVGDIIEEFHISRSHLYRLLGDEGGVKALIRQRRLERLYNDLLGHRVTSKTWKAMAHDYGFSSAQALKRAFLRHYGFAPSVLLATNRGNGGDENPAPSAPLRR